MQMLFRIRYTQHSLTSLPNHASTYPKKILKRSINVYCKKTNLEKNRGIRFDASLIKKRIGNRYFSSLVPSADSSVQRTTVSSDGKVAIPIDFDTASIVEGEESQIVTVTLKPNQILRAESGAMIFMTEGIEMETTTGGGISSGFKRMLTGQHLFISDFSYNGAEGTTGQVGLGTDFPSKILKLNVQEYGGKIVCQKGALLCASHTIDIEMEFAKKMTTGFFGGEGFVLQALTGEGDVFIKAGGTLIKKELAENEVLRVSSGSLVAFENGVEFDVQTIPGFKNVVFGGEGLFITTLTGPGSVWLQGMPPDRMINEIARRVPSGGPGMGILMNSGGGQAEDVSDVESDDGETDTPSEADGNSENGEIDALSEADAAIQADRNAAVLSSGIDSSMEDPDSPSALFGDAAAPETEDDSSMGIHSTNNDEYENETTTFSNNDQEFTDLDESTFSNNEQQESTWDDFQEDNTSFDTEESFSGNNNDEDAGQSVLDTLWDLFTGGDDD